MKKIVALLCLAAALAFFPRSGEAAGLNKKLSVGFRIEEGAAEQQDYSIEIRNRGRGAYYQSSGQLFKKGQVAQTAVNALHKELLREGVKVVSPAVLDRIRKDRKAAEVSRALESGSLTEQQMRRIVSQVNRQFGIAQLMVGSVTVGNATPDNYGIFTGSATLELSLYDKNGNYLIAEQTEGIDRGPNPAQATLRAVQKAAQMMVGKLMRPNIGANDGRKVSEYTIKATNVSRYRMVTDIINVCWTVPGVRQAQEEIYESRFAEIVLRGDFDLGELIYTLSTNLDNAEVSKRGNSILISF